MIKSGSTIKNIVIGLRTLVQENAVIEDTLILGADFYETKDVSNLGGGGGHFKARALARACSLRGPPACR